MRKNLRTAAVVGTAAAGLILIPAGIAYASGGQGPHRSGDPASTCTYDQQQDRQQLRDGTGVQHPVQAAPVGAAHQSGPLDGSGPQADRPLDGTGNQWGVG